LFSIQSKTTKWEAVSGGGVYGEKMDGKNGKKNFRCPKKKRESEGKTMNTL